MYLANPWALALLSLIPLIVLLHRRKIERRDYIVSAIFLWDETLKEQHSKPGNRKLNFNYRLWLQIIAVAALAFALAHPYLPVLAAPAHRVVMVMDVSASMRSMKDGKELFFAAKNEAHALIKKLPQGAEAMILEAGAHTSVKSYFTDNKDLLHRTVESLRATDEPGRLKPALSLASSFVSEEGEIYLFTDAPGLSEAALETVYAHVTPVIVSGGSKNVGITGMAVRRKRDGSGDHQLFIRVTNFTGHRVETGFSLHLNRKQVHSRNLVLNTDSAMELIFPLTGLWAGEVLASLNLNDDLIPDNYTYALLSGSPTMRILLVTAGNFFLEKALDAHPGVVVTKLNGLDGNDLTTLMQEHDIAIFDGIPAPVLPEGSYLIINSPVVKPGIDIRGSGLRTASDILLPDHPVLKDLHGDEFRVTTVSHAQMPDGGQVIMGEDGAPLLYGYSIPNIRLVYLGFRLQDSDLPLTPAFPVLLGNILKWLQPEAAGDRSLQVSTGENYEMDFGTRDLEVIVDGPWGRQKVPLFKGRLNYSEARRAGIYKVNAMGKEQWFAANLFNEQESDLRLTEGREAINWAGRAERNDEEGASHPIWRYILLLALGCMSIEGLLSSLKY